MAPRLVAELDEIDAGLQRVASMIRPHTSLRRSQNSLTALSKDFAEYKDCL